jgi:hypothetical protein
MLPVVTLIFCLVIGFSINAAAENDVPKPPKSVLVTQVLYSAPLGSLDVPGLDTWTASVVNLDSIPATVTVEFCTSIHCTLPLDCVQVTLLPQHGCEANLFGDGVALYARITVVSEANPINVRGLLSVQGFPGAPATVPAH